MTHSTICNTRARKVQIQSESNIYIEKLQEALTAQQYSNIMELWNNLVCFSAVDEGLQYETLIGH